MTIVKVEKQKTLRNSFLKIQFFLLIFACSTSLVYGQKSVESKFSPHKIGFLYNLGNEKNFIFDDPDYYYSSNAFKAQIFYKLGSYKNFNFELIIQPQFQQIKHQLLNRFFVTDIFGDVENKRIAYTKLKTLYFYAFELGFSSSVNLLDKLDFKFTLGLGAGYIDTVTERVAKGFTFVENFSFGFNYKTSKKTSLYLGTNFGHISNLDFQFPNSGYNIIGLELGFTYLLE